MRKQSLLLPALAASLGLPKPDAALAAGDLIVDDANIPHAVNSVAVTYDTVTVADGGTGTLTISDGGSVSNTVYCCLHIVVDTAPRNATKNTECMPESIKQQLMGLKGIRSHQKGTAVRELNMSHLQFNMFACDGCPILTPIKLKGFSGPEYKWHKGTSTKVILSLQREGFFRFGVGIPDINRDGSSMIISSFSTI